jgi:hypothetical protein
MQGWSVTAVQTSRREPNWWAWHDSRGSTLHFYHSSWSSLHRIDGWFARLDLAQGAAEAQAVVLVSQFPTTDAARHAYSAILPEASGLVSLHIGDNAAEWPTSAGAASGAGGLVGYFGSYTTFVQANEMLAEIYAYVGGKKGEILRSLSNPGRAIAAQLSTSP